MQMLCSGTSRGDVLLGPRLRPLSPCRVKRQHSAQGPNPRSVPCANPIGCAYAHARSRDRSSLARIDPFAPGDDVDVNVHEAGIGASSTPDDLRLGSGVLSRDVGVATTAQNPLSLLGVESVEMVVPRSADVTVVAPLIADGHVKRTRTSSPPPSL
jgi:hypothetical protein